MSNLGSRSTQRSAISTSSSSESAVVSLVLAAIPMASILRDLRGGSPRPVEPSRSSPARSVRSASRSYSPGVVPSEVDRRSFLRLTAASAAGIAVGAGLVGCATPGSGPEHAASGPAGAPRPPTPAQWSALAASLTGHLVRPGAARLRDGQAPLQPEVRRARAARGRLLRDVDGRGEDPRVRADPRDPSGGALRRAQLRRLLERIGPRHRRRDVDARHPARARRRAGPPGSAQARGSSTSTTSSAATASSSPAARARPSASRGSPSAAAWGSSLAGTGSPRTTSRRSHW